MPRCCCPLVRPPGGFVRRSFSFLPALLYIIAKKRTKQRRQLSYRAIPSFSVESSEGKGRKGRNGAGQHDGRPGRGIDTSCKCVADGSVRFDTSRPRERGQNMSVRRAVRGVGLLACPMSCWDEDGNDAGLPCCRWWLDTRRLHSILRQEVAGLSFMTTRAFSLVRTPPCLAALVLGG